MDEINQITILISNSRTACPSSILLLILSSLGNLLKDACIIFHKDVEDFKTSIKMLIFGLRCSPLKIAKKKKIKYTHIVGISVNQASCN